MVKPPKIRHSKARRDPVTIDLDANEVKPEAGADKPESPTPAAVESTEPASAASSAEPPKPETKAESPTAAKVTPEASPSPDTARPEAPKGIDPAPAFGRGARDEAPRPGAASSKPSSPPPPRSDAPKGEPRRGGVSAIAAGIIGGLVTLAGAGALQWAGIIPAPSQGGQTVDLTGINAEIASLKQAVADLPAQGAPAGSDAETAGRIDTLGASIDTLKADLAALQSSVAAGGAGENAGLDALGKRIDAMQAQVDALGEGPDTSALDERIGALDTAVKAATDAAGAAAAAGQSNADGIAAVGTRVDELAGRVEALAGQVEQQAANPKIALAIAAAGLKAAIDRGSPFMAELETYAAVAPDAPEIAALRDMAAAGVPTREEIADEAADASIAIIDTTQTTAPDAGFLDRLLASAMSLIKVRPVGMVEGEGVPATAARIEAAVKAGDYARALSEYETLPDGAKAAASGFIAKVEARKSADELVEKALSGALRS